MRKQETAARQGRALAAVLVVLILLISGFTIYFKCRTLGEDDPVLLAELAGVEFPQAASKSAGNDDWPQWRGKLRDGVSRETNFLTAWPADGLKVLWQVKAGEGYSSFAVADGRVYTMLQDGDDEAVVCFAAKTGKELWRFKYDCHYRNSFGNGPRSTPIVDGGFVFAVGATGLLHCLKADTGEKVWRHDLLAEFSAENLQWGVSFSPLVEGDLVFTNPGGAGGNSLAAFNKKDGKLVWKSGNDPAGYSSPMAASFGGVSQIVFFTGSGLVSVTPEDGKELWRYPWETSYGANIATPIVAGDYVFISSGYDRGCTLLKIVKSGAKFEAKRVYEHNQFNNHFATSVLYKDHIYGFHDSMLTCLDFRTGKTKWKERGFNKGSLLIAGDHLIILGEQGKLALAEASSTEYKEKASFQALHGKCWSAPVLSAGLLYVRDEEEIKCLDLRAN